VVTQFFLLPLAVVAGLVGVFLLFNLATRQTSSPRDHLETLTQGRFNQRWQAAFELSRQIRDGAEFEKDPTLLVGISQVFKEIGQDPDRDPRIRRYLALALGRSREKGAIEALLEGAEDADGETRFYSLWGLAQIRASEAGPLFLEGLKDADPAVRALSAHGLGTLPDGTGIEPLRGALKDATEAVRWNAALALGRKGDATGEEILIRLIDRDYLSEFTSLDDDERTSIILNALRALNHLKTGGLKAKIEALASSDPDSRVREAARALTESYGD